jgi:GPH family glycoside/pentoside/hexuronide:cation symporter
MIMKYQSFFYGLGTLGRSSLGFIVGSWLLYYYLPPDGEPLIPAALFGVAVLTGRLLSAFVTPHIGFLSDNAHSHYGRRLPFMFISAIIIIITFVLLWKPPFLNAQSIWNWVYLLIITVLFRFSLALYQVPFQALLPELAKDEAGRVSLSTWDSAFLLLGMMWGGGAGVLIEKNGYFSMAFLYALVALIAFYLPFFFLREGQPDAQRNDSFGFRQSLSLTLKNREFVHFAIIWVLYIVATGFVQTAVPYIVTEVCLLRESGTTFYFYLPGVITSLVCYPLIGRATKKWGKWKVYAVSFFASALIFPGTMLIGEWFPLPLGVQCSSWAVLQSASIAGVVILTSTFAAEITDRDNTGREGMYFASLKVIDQIFSGLASILLPLLLTLGISHTLPQGAIGVKLTGAVGGGLMLIGFFLFLRYPRYN